MWRQGYFSIFCTTLAGNQTFFPSLPWVKHLTQWSRSKDSANFPCPTLPSLQLVTPSPGPYLASSIRALGYLHEDMRY
jgi:hypothetical protein